MKVLTLIVISFLIMSSLCYGQDDFCSSYSEEADTVYIPHYGYNEVLDSVLLETYPERDQVLQNARTSVGYIPDNIPFHILIKVWIYHDDGGFGFNDALSESDVFDLIDGVNDHFNTNAAGIRFHLKYDIEHVFSTNFNSNIENDSEFFSMLDTYHEPKALNWHLIYDSDAG